MRVFCASSCSVLPTRRNSTTWSSRNAPGMKRRSPRPLANDMPRNIGLSSWSGPISIQMRSSFFHNGRKPSLWLASRITSLNARGAGGSPGAVGRTTGAPGTAADGALPAFAAAGAGAVPLATGRPLATPVDGDCSVAHPMRVNVEASALASAERVNRDIGKGPAGGIRQRKSGG
jgi:hypothetical protein